jgi:hypothetical protein
MRFTDAVLALSAALAPARIRAAREEQWRADLQDGPAMGISETSLLFGALRSSATARSYDLLGRGGNWLSRTKKGENMKLVLGIAGAAAILAGAAVVGVQANAQTEQAEVPLVKAPMENRPIGGYEGWWNSTPASGSTEGLPQETVTVNTRTGKIVDAFNRATNSTQISDVDYDLVPDPSWPANSIVIIDTTSGSVIEDFLIDERGVPLDENGRPLDAPAG